MRLLILLLLSSHLMADDSWMVERSDQYHQCSNYGRGCSLLSDEEKKDQLEGAKRVVEYEIEIIESTLSWSTSKMKSEQISINFPNLKYACAMLYILDDTSKDCDAIFKKTSAFYADKSN